MKIIQKIIFLLLINSLVVGCSKNGPDVIIDKSNDTIKITIKDDFGGGAYYNTEETYFKSQGKVINKRNKAEYKDIDEALGHMMRDYKATKKTMK